MFGVLNATSGVIVDTYPDPYAAQERVTLENENDPESIYTVVPI